MCYAAMLWFLNSCLSLSHALAVWPDLAKFCHFGSTLKHFGHFESIDLVFAKVLSLFWQICYAIGLIFIQVNIKQII